METIIRPSKNGRGDTVVLGLPDYNQMMAELELLQNLADAEEDVRNGRVAPIQETFDSIRQALPVILAV